MTNIDLSSLYRRYIDCLNARDLDRLEDFVHSDVHYNGRRIGLSGYRAMLQGNYRDIPDLRFHIQLLVADAATVASRLNFDCRPVGRFLDMDVNGRRVSFSEHVLYEFEDLRIRTVWSLIDKAAIAHQLASTA
ncbi:ester cyclase [Aquincola sp. MAHUQ-54]|uniref:Ester cyclase n=1 Tax=Aquincola agrisoli TaxID=3119538 RepID=A0AAW9QH37_9BURK